MTRRILARRPSGAGVIAVLALVLALGGTATAASLITSKQIKNNSIKGKDVKNRTLKAADVAVDALGGGQVDESQLGKVPSAAAADTAATATTATNATQLGGTAAAAYVRNVEVVTATSTDAGATKQAFPTCPAPKKAIGGGAQLSGTDRALIEVSRPIVGTPPTQWYAQAEALDGTDTNYTLSATVICAEVG